jgi:DNA repair exonuclease SbcCD ATPase subunit
MSDETSLIAKYLERIEEGQEKLNEAYHGLDKQIEILSSRFADHLEQDNLNLERISAGLSNINERLQEYNTSLEIHIAGVNELRKMNEILSTRVEQEARRVSKLEEPFKWAEKTKKYAIWLAAIATAVTSVTAAIKYLVP